MQWTKSQTKKIAYSLVAIFILGIIITVSIFLFHKDLPQEILDKKDIIVSGILTYGSGVLLLLKTISFIAGEIRKKRLSSNEKIEKFMTKEIEKKEQEPMKKDKKITKETTVSNVYEIGNYKFILNEKKGIHITWEGEFNYQEFKYANVEFIEKIRKIVQKDY